jgi:hypothetical protein
VDYLVGLAESLYLDDQFGAAALFATVLGRVDIDPAPTIG